MLKILRAEAFQRKLTQLILHSVLSNCRPALDSSLWHVLSFPRPSLGVATQRLPTIGTLPPLTPPSESESVTTTSGPAKSESKLLYDWRFTANQFVLAPNLLRLTTRVFFNWILAIINYVTSSLTRRWIFMITMLGLLSSVSIAQIECFWKFFVLHYVIVQVLCQYRLCYNGSLVTWTVVRLTTPKFKPLIFSTSGFALSCTLP
jgi:hypothetical protein